jgi:adenylate cyclase
LVVGERRLAAIMFTDMVGYTALGQKNESLSLTLAEEQRTLLRPIFTRHGGREVKTIGDAFLVEFSSALEAARCAYDIQRSTREFNLTLPEERRVHLRVGVHLGDVVEFQGDISGDAVNVASRIESLAEAGGVCLTRQVYDHIHNKFELPMTSLGGKQLKNVSVPVEVYKMLMPWEGATAEEQKALDKHRVAVLPLKNLSPDPNDEYFADGMTEELITVLSGVRELTVVARTSVMQYKASPKRVADVARELKTGTIIEGSVRKAANKVRITVQMVDAETEGHLWAQNFDRQMDDIFGIQTDIAKRVAKSLKVKLLPKEVERMESRAPENTSAYSAYLKGRTLLVSRTEADLKVAKELFESAIAMDPAYAPAYSGLADAYILLRDYSLSIPQSTANRQARELVSKALELNPDLAEARATLGLLLSENYDFAGAEKELRRAISLNPSYSNAHHWLGQFVLASQGRYQESLEELNIAELADPMSIAVLLRQFTLQLLYAGNVEHASRILAKAGQLYPEHQLTKEMNIFSQYYSGNYTRAIELALEAIGGHETSRRVVFLQMLVMAYSANGNQAEARKWLAKMEKLHEETPYRSDLIATAYAGLGERDQFFNWSRRAAEEKAWFFARLRLIDKEIPAMRNIRQDPRFIEMFKKVGLEA